MLMLFIIVIGFIIFCNLYVAKTMSIQEMHEEFCVFQEFMNNKLINKILNKIHKIAANTFYSLAWIIKISQYRQNKKSTKKHMYLCKMTTEERQKNNKRKKRRNNRINAFIFALNLITVIIVTVIFIIPNWDFNSLIRFQRYVISGILSNLILLFIAIGCFINIK